MVEGGGTIVAGARVVVIVGAEVVGLDVVPTPGGTSGGSPSLLPTI